MKLIKFIALFTSIILCLSLVGCANQNEDDAGTKERIINAPYAYSSNSKTLHHNGCYHVKRISDANLGEYYGDPADMVANGFKLCSACFPNSNVNNNTNNNDNGISEEDATYVINTGTRRFHEKDCDHALNSSNTEYTDLSYEELVDENYEPCQVCLKNYKGDNAE